jgi:hypothetical protein
MGGLLTAMFESRPRSQDVKDPAQGCFVVVCSKEETFKKLKFLLIHVPQFFP